MGRLTGKVAIVTGAASQAEGVGNGAALAIDGGFQAIRPWPR